MRFTKMQGAGNDYVYVNCVEEPVPANPAALAREISDRHFGVGSDGLILIHPSQRADVRMQMFNADGSEAQMCGNGIRCVAKYAYDHGLVSKPRIAVETRAGVLDIELQFVGGHVTGATVDMGVPVLEAARIPVMLPNCDPASPIVDVPLDQYIPHGPPASWVEEHGSYRRVTCVSMGNPHMVIYCRQVVTVPLEIVGPFFEHLAFFPERINVHFVEVQSPTEVTMRTWERGSGITLACGTGACAVCVAGVLTHRTQRKLLAHLPGGDLTLDWDEPSGQVRLTGPAVEIYSGDWESNGAS